MGRHCVLARYGDKRGRGRRRSPRGSVQHGDCHVLGRVSQRGRRAGGGDFVCARGRGRQAGCEDQSASSTAELQQEGPSSEKRWARFWWLTGKLGGVSVAGEGDGSCESVNGREEAAGESSDGEWTMGKLRHSRLTTHVTWNGGLVI